MKINNMGLEDNNFKKEETPQEKLLRVYNYVTDFLNKFHSLRMTVNMSKTDEEMREKIKEIITPAFSILPTEKNPETPKRIFATPEEVEKFFPEFTEKLENLRLLLLDDKELTKESFWTLEKSVDMFGYCRKSYEDSLSLLESDKKN